MPLRQKYSDDMQAGGGLVNPFLAPAVLVPPTLAVFAVVGVLEVAPQSSQRLHGPRIINDVRPPVFQPQQLRRGRQIEPIEAFSELRCQSQNLFLRR